MNVQHLIYLRFSQFHLRLLRPLLVISLFLFGFIPSIQAQQNSLQRVSVATRDDGKGQVLRFHLTQTVDSFRVYQHEVHLIQLSLYDELLDTTAIQLPEDSPIFDEISFYDIPFGIGVDIYVSEGSFFKSDAYRDAKSNDLLLGLTETDKTELEYLTEGLEPIIWSRFTVTEENLLAGGSETDKTTFAASMGYQKVKSKMQFDVVVLDAGHGGYDPGSIGYNGVIEKEIALAITKKVGGYINEYLPEVEVVYTRDGDEYVGLKERGSIANRHEGDLFVSIHCNSNRSSQPYGTDVFFLGLERSQTALEVMKRENTVVSPNDDSEQQKLTPQELLVYELANSGYIATSERIAGMIEYQLDERAKRHSRGVKQARFVVLYHASMPAVLIETGFISNPSEARYLSSEYGQSIIASAIFRAIRNYKEDYEKSQHFTTN